jgi:hypothetical protein
MADSSNNKVYFPIANAVHNLGNEEEERYLGPGSHRTFPDAEPRSESHHCIDGWSGGSQIVSEFG